MGFINKTSEITADAILTKSGRERIRTAILGSNTNGEHQITKFALSDDEVDYSHWEITPTGSAQVIPYGQIIDNQLLIEPTFNTTEMMRHLLYKYRIDFTDIAVPTPLIDQNEVFDLYTGIEGQVVIKIQVDQFYIITHVNSENGSETQISPDFPVGWWDMKTFIIWNFNMNDKIRISTAGIPSHMSAGIIAKIYYLGNEYTTGGLGWEIVSPANTDWVNLGSGATAEPWVLAGPTNPNWPSYNPNGPNIHPDLLNASWIWNSGSTLDQITWEWSPPWVPVPVEEIPEEPTGG
tara:strand:+ start:80 stop:958 length:879 start_codon:yes stop_codon:yes gene_type:complete